MRLPHPFGFGGENSSPFGHSLGPTTSREKRWAEKEERKLAIRDLQCWRCLRSDVIVKFAWGGSLSFREHSSNSADLLFVGCILAFCLSGPSNPQKSERLDKLCIVSLILNALFSFLGSCIHARCTVLCAVKFIVFPSLLWVSPFLHGPLAYQKSLSSPKKPWSE